MQRIAFHPSDYQINPANFIEFDVLTGTQTEPLPTMKNGDPAEVIMVACGKDDGFTFAVGDSSVDASATPMFAIAEGADPVFVFVRGATHFSVNNTTGVAGAITVAPLGDS